MIFQSDIYAAIGLGLSLLLCAFLVTGMGKRPIAGRCVLGCYLGAFACFMILACKAPEDYKTANLRAMTPDLNDPASNYVLLSYVELCEHGYPDTSQPCAVAVIQNIAGSTLTADQKARARQYVAQHANLSARSVPFNL